MSLTPTDGFDDFEVESETLESARAAASGEVREALNRHFHCPADLEGVADAETRALIAQHARALARRFLTHRDGAVSKKVSAEAKRAEEWLAEVKAGRTALVLPRRAATGPQKAPAVAVVGPYRRPEITKDLWRTH